MTKLSDLMVREGEERAVATYNRTVEKGQLAFVKRGRHLISASTKTLEDWVVRWRAKCQHRETIAEAELKIYDALTDIKTVDGLEGFGLPSDILAFVVTDCVFTTLGHTFDRKIESVKMASMLGQRVQDEIVYSMLKELDGPLWKDSQKYVKKGSSFIRKTAARREFIRRGYNVKLWSPPFRSTIGHWLLEAMRIVTGHLEFFSKKEGAGHNHYTHYCRLTEDVWNYLSRSTDDDIGSHPRFTPDFVKPEPWESVNSGGFTDSSIQLPFISSLRDVNYDFYLDRDLGEAPKAADKLSSVPWTVDAGPAELFREFIDSNRERAGLVPATAEELPPKLKASEVGRERAQSRRRERGVVYKRNRDNAAKRAAYRRSAVLHKRLDKPFYFSHRCDGRGRMYAIGEYLNYQGGDFGRGCLVFAEGKPVDEQGLRWLKIHGANLAGEDKETFEDRVAWVDKNHDLVMEVAEDPRAQRYWEDLDEPFQFLSWAQDYARVQAGGLSHTPVSLDGSNNGLQLFALLLRDEHLGRQTNVLPVEKPNDIYADVVGRVVPLMDEDTMDLSSKDGEHARTLLAFFDKHFDGKPPRALGKRPVMTKAYNVSLYAVTDYVDEWFREEFPEEFGPYERHRLARYLAKKLWAAMEDRLQGASTGMAWLKSAAKMVVTEKNEIPWWTSPSGLPCFQPYYKHDAQKIELVFGQRTWTRRVRGEDKKVNIRKQKVVNGVSPNFVHSVDGAIVHKVVLEMEKQIPGCSLRVVHDSFGTHACDAQALSETIRQVVYEVAKSDPLAALKEQWEVRYGLDLPELPEYGELDLEEVLNAEYMYS